MLKQNSKKEQHTIDTDMKVLNNLKGSQEHNSLELLRSPMQMTFLRISSHISDSTKMTIHSSQISLEIKEMDSNSSNNHNQAETIMDLVVSVGLEALEVSVDLADQAIITTCLEDLVEQAITTTCLEGLAEQTTICSVD